MNEHMNVFKPYAEGDAIENNVSRSFAIVLDGNRLVTERFTDLINVALSSANQKVLSKLSSKDDFSIDIQRNANDIAGDCEGVRRIIPVTLTPETAPDEENSGGSENPIPDIYIVYRDGDEADLIIIEVKVNSNSAVAQVKHQADCIQKAMKENGTEVTVSPVVKLSWKEIVKLLLDVDNLEGGRDIILRHYIEYIRRNYASWLPAAPFSGGISEELLQGRLSVLARNCALLLHNHYAGRNEEFSASSVKYGDGRKGQTISFNPLWGYAQEIHVVFNSKYNVFEVNFWPGNNVGQSWQLFGDGSITKEDMSWVNNDNLLGLPFEASLYVKFSDTYGRYVMEAYPSFDVATAGKSGTLQEFSWINRQWTRDSWDDLKSKLSEYLSEEAAKSFAVNFAECFDNSGRNVLNTAIGFEISVKIPASKFAELDKKNPNFGDNEYPYKDGAAKLVADVIEALRQMIEH